MLTLCEAQADLLRVKVEERTQRALATCGLSVGEMEHVQVSPLSKKKWNAPAYTNLVGWGERRHRLQREL